MKIQLFNPPVGYYAGVNYRMNPPLGLPILSAVLRAAGHESEVVDLEILEQTPQSIEKAFADSPESWPDVVGFTALTSSARGAAESIAAIRRAGFTGRVVVGGVHATLYPEVPQEWGADLVITGECEGNVVSLLESGATGIHAGESLRMADVPAPDWLHHTPSPSEYDGNSPNMGSKQAITMWSRGCPHKCIMCGNAIFGHQATRFRPVDNIVAELKALAPYQTVKSLFVYDDELIGQRLPDGWSAALAAKVGPIGYLWKCQGRCSRRYVDTATLSDFYKAGCRIIMWGCESFSQTTLNAMRKGTTVADNWHSLRAAKMAGMKNFVLSMIGNVQEGESEVAETCAGLAQAYREGLVDYRQTTIVTALPGTPLWDMQVRDGWFQKPPDTGPQMHQVYSDTPWLSGERLQYWAQRIDSECPVFAEGPRR